MGAKPSAAANAAATPTALSDNDTPAISRFGMPHALVIIACIVTAAILAPPASGIRDVLLLLGGAGSIGATVVGVAVTGGRRAGRFGRLVRAYFSSGN
ncbi:hypothetical protein [Streptomyces sp. NPDC001621]|uniref:hypothetical protein n=1 Tax=Streptomyces sp. NPDC001621 TaxID=3364594 RepID=UPI003675C732